MEDLNFPLSQQCVIAFSDNVRNCTDVNCLLDAANQLFDCSFPDNGSNSNFNSSNNNSINNANWNNNNANWNNNNANWNNNNVNWNNNANWNNNNVNWNNNMMNWNNNVNWNNNMMNWNDNVNWNDNNSGLAISNLNSGLNVNGNNMMGRGKQYGQTQDIVDCSIYEEGSEQFIACLNPNGMKGARRTGSIKNKSQKRDIRVFGGKQYACKSNGKGHTCSLYKKHN